MIPTALMKTLSLCEFPPMKRPALCVNSTVWSLITGLSLLPPQGSVTKPGFTSGEARVQRTDSFFSELTAAKCCSCVVV